MKRVDLFVIDGENDFCASGKESDGRRGALHVEGADKEAVLVANMIKRLGDKITHIHATLDQHHENDIAHPGFWKGKDGTSPAPFTMISVSDVENHVWVPRLTFAVPWEGKSISMYDYALLYVKKLKEQGRNDLIIWPPHCLIGSWGSCVYPPLMDAYHEWAKQTGRWIDFVEKGRFPLTEHYSAMRADVMDSTRPETQLNVDLLTDVAKADIICWCGWAGSHCLRWTALDAVNYFGTGQNDFLKKSVFLEDAAAAVGDLPGSTLFSDWRKQFLDEVKSRGATVMKTTEFLVT